MDHPNVRGFGACESAVVAVPTKAGHEKNDIRVTENEVLGKGSGDSLGLDYEVKWDGLDDPDNPRSMATAGKWLFIFILASVSLIS